MTSLSAGSALELPQAQSLSNILDALSRFFSIEKRASWGRECEGTSTGVGAEDFDNSSRLEAEILVNTQPRSP
jgi:hypothetical protein